MRLTLSVQFNIPRSMLEVNPLNGETSDWLQANEAEYQATLTPTLEASLNEAIPVHEPPRVVAARIEHTLRTKWPEHEWIVILRPNLGW